MIEFHVVDGEPRQSRPTAADGVFRRVFGTDGRARPMLAAGVRRRFHDSRRTRTAEWRGPASPVTGFERDTRTRPRG